MKHTRARHPRPTPKLAVVIPVYNEERQLEQSVLTVHRFLQDKFGSCCEIIIADNASTDDTPRIASRIAERNPSVKALRLEKKGRGFAIKHAWLASDAGILSYMDVDLSSDLGAFPDLIRGLDDGRFDLAAGSRLLCPELTTRGFKRQFISRCYNILVKLFFMTKFSDAQCGFKAITREAAGILLPLVEDTDWFFDTELLVVAETLGYRVNDLPVKWIDDPDSRVDIVRTAIDDIRGLIRVRTQLWQKKHQGLLLPAKSWEPPSGDLHRIEAEPHVRRMRGTGK